MNIKTALEIADEHKPEDTWNRPEIWALKVLAGAVRRYRIALSKYENEASQNEAP